MNRQPEETPVVNKPWCYFYPVRLVILILSFAFGSFLAYYLGLVPIDAEHLGRDITIIQGMIMGWCFHWWLHD